MIPRLKETYSKEIQPGLKDSLNLKNIFMAPTIQKIVLKLLILHFLIKKYNGSIGKLTKKINSGVIFFGLRILVDLPGRFRIFEP